MIKTVIFDFNGTLYFDADINYETWKQTLNELTRGRLDFDSFFSEFRSVHDHVLIQEVIKRYPDLENENVEQWVQRKEYLYRKMCVDTRRNKLCPGASEVLNYLKENKVNLGLCTSSIIENVNFYYQNVQLGNWFSLDKTIYDNGKYHNKIEMYQDAAKLFNETTANILVFEDSPKSIQNAIDAGVNKIVAIKCADTPHLPQIKQIIKDFFELDYSIFE